MTIDRWIVDGAMRHPEKPAIVFGKETITYSGMAGRIDARTRVLQHEGIEPGDRIAWYGLNSPEVFILLFACARLGAILVPLNWRLAEPEVASVVTDCEPKLVYYDHDFAQRALALCGTTPKSIDTPIDPAIAENKQPAGDISDPVLLVYTSGSTGQPKGAVLTQQALVSNAAMSVEAHQMTGDDRVLNVLPLFHVGGLNILPTPAFSIGATVVLHERFEPDDACAALGHVTLAIVVPTVLQAIMASDVWVKSDISTMRGMSIGSTDVPVSLIEAVHARGVPLLQVYGATETSPFAIYQSLENALTHVGSIGRAGSHCQIRLVSEGRDVGIGEPGEIWVKGNNVLREYWNDPELTSQMLVDGWFRTGDLATIDTDGYYWFTDRIKHVIISGGENIYPTEIERVLREVPGIVEVCVVGIPDPKWGEKPVAVVVTQRVMNCEEVLASLVGKLARYKHPKEVVFVDELPRNATGKVIASKVRDLLSSNHQHEMQGKAE